MVPHDTTSVYHPEPDYKDSVAASRRIADLALRRSTHTYVRNHYARTVQPPPNVMQSKEEGRDRLAAQF